MGRSRPREPDRRAHRLQRGPVPADRAAAPHVHRAQAARGHQGPRRLRRGARQGRRGRPRRPQSPWRGRLVRLPDRRGLGPSRGRFLAGQGLRRRVRVLRAAGIGPELVRRHDLLDRAGPGRRVWSRLRFLRRGPRDADQRRDQVRERHGRRLHRRPRPERLDALHRRPRAAA